MRRLSHNGAIFLTISVFVLTIAFNYLLPGYAVVAGGFLLAIFLTTFIRSRYATQMAVFVSLVLTIVHAILFYNDSSSAIFLCLGRLNEGKTTAQIAEFDLKQFILDTTEEMQSLLKPLQSIEVEYSGSERIHSDKKLLKNVLINLLSNAIKFSPEDGSIKVKGKFDNGNAQVTVADHGIGISPEDQEHLFSSFYRGKNAINIQGTGLGLHIVKRYVQLLNGDIYLDSRLNEGTKVTFEIPSTIKPEL